MTASSTAYEVPAAAPYPSPQDREQLILKYAPVVRYIVGRMVIATPQHLDFDDLLSYGTLGLIEAVDRYDPTRGINFETFAVDRIRGSVIDALRAADWIPHSSRRRAKAIQQTYVQLEERLGRAPSDEEVADELRLSLSKLHRAMADSMCTVESLHREVRTSHDDGTPSILLDYLHDEGMATPGQEIEQRELHESVVEALRRLDDRERLVLSLYYQKGLTLREISDVMEISETRVWQLHARAIMRIRGYIGLSTRK